MYLRLLGAAAIVWFHTPQSQARLAVGPFLAVFAYLSFVQAANNQNSAGIIRRQVHTLLVPWIGWWLIYATARVWMARGLTHAIAQMGSGWELAAWPHINLWYLPYVYVNTLLVLAVRALMIRMSYRLKLVAALGSGLAGLVALAFLQDLPPFAAQWMRGMPAVGIGVVYGVALRQGGRTRRMALLGIFVIVSLAVVPAAVLGVYDIAVAYAGGALLMLFCSVRLPRIRMISRLASLTLGIYLSHGLVMWVLWKLFGVTWSPWLFAPLTFVVCTVLVSAMRRVRLLRLIV